MEGAATTNQEESSTYGQRSIAAHVSGSRERPQSCEPLRRLPLANTRPRSAASDVRWLAKAALAQQVNAIQQQLLLNAKLDEAKARRESLLRTRTAAAASCTAMPLASPRRCTATAAFAHAPDGPQACKELDRQWDRMCRQKQASATTSFQQEMQLQRQAEKQRLKAARQLPPQPAYRANEGATSGVAAKGRAVPQQLSTGHSGCGAEAGEAAAAERRAHFLQLSGERQEACRGRARQLGAEKAERVLQQHALRLRCRAAATPKPARLEHSAHVETVQGRFQQLTAEGAAHRQLFGSMLDTSLQARALAVAQDQRTRAQQRQSAAEAHAAMVLHNRRQQQDRWEEHLEATVGHKLQRMAADSAQEHAARAQREASLQEQCRQHVLATHWTDRLHCTALESKSLPAMDARITQVLSRCEK